MIDIHTHILPGMDDGSESVDESLEMLREQARQGVNAVVLTPHFYAGQNSPQRFLERRAEAWSRLAPYRTPDLPELYLGAEVQYFEGITHTEGLKELCINQGNLLLMEMPFSQTWSRRTVQDVLELNSRDDVQVILAHIERYYDYQDKKVWETLLRCGVLMQANSAFFQNWKTRGKAKRLLNHGFIHIIASDCHNMSKRPPNLKKAYQITGNHPNLIPDDFLLNVIKGPYGNIRPPHLQ